jgi:hypothetical protein
VRRPCLHTQHASPNYTYQPIQRSSLSDAVWVEFLVYGRICVAHAVTPERPEALYLADGSHRKRERFLIPSLAGALASSPPGHARCWRAGSTAAAGFDHAAKQSFAREGRGEGRIMATNGQPPMVDEQAVIVFLRQLDHALSGALGADEQRRLRWLTVTHALVMAVLADPRHLDLTLRRAADGLAQLNS